MKTLKPYHIIYLLFIYFLLAGSCKKDNPVIEPTLQGLWGRDIGFSHMEMFFSSDSVIQYVANSSDSLHNPIYTEYARGIFKILPDTSFLNRVDSIVYSGKHIKIHVWQPGSTAYELIYGVFELSKDSLLIHTYCCKMTQRYHRINKAK
ncbi:MAG: hypothetical protein Q8M15_12660 [Bacteroidota bacterium]|nr:hypothetical protein [Bacteroidota bacterium]